MKAKLMPVAFAVNDIATAGLTDTEFGQLRRLLEKVRNNLTTTKD